MLSQGLVRFDAFLGEQYSSARLEKGDVIVAGAENRETFGQFARGQHLMRDAVDQGTSPRSREQGPFCATNHHPAGLCEELCPGFALQFSP
jgi:hypothetical protein